MGHLKHIFIVPWNGYVNRLQALASASIAAQQLGVSLQVSWESEPVAPAPPEDIFSAGLVERHFVPPGEVTKILGQPHQTMPRYFTSDPERKTAFLAGHDKGEQVFMPAVTGLTELESNIQTLVIVAGGKFHLPGCADFISKRREFYMTLEWNQEIDNRASHLLSLHDAYLGLHIRETDRSREAPAPAIIKATLKRLSEKTGIDTVFIAADTERARAEWTARTDQMGLRAWTSESQSLDRHESTAAQDAMIDWRVLGGADSIVYSATSSFGEEAAIMNAQPHQSLGLQASMGLRLIRDTRRIWALAEAKLRSLTLAE